MNIRTYLFAVCCSGFDRVRATLKYVGETSLLKLFSTPLDVA